MINSKNRNFQTIEEFIFAAAEFEQQSAEFYRNILNTKETEGIVKELLVLLEKQELAHKKTLQDMDISQTREIIQFPPKLSLSMPAPKYASLSLAVLLDIAIERERISKEIYAHTAGQVTGNFRNIIIGLSVFEQEHEDKLISLREYY
jgi:rubrerythrin